MSQASVSRGQATRIFWKPLKSLDCHICVQDSGVAIFAIPAECLPGTGPASPAPLLQRRQRTNSARPSRASSMLCENAARGPGLNKGVDRLSWGSGQRNFLAISTDRWRWAAVSIIVYTALAWPAAPQPRPGGESGGSTCFFTLNNYF